MMERRKLVSLWKRDAAGVLVTLVRVEGSSYRRPGARLFTTSMGAGYAGTISGGCLESEVIRRAQWIAREQAAVERYATTFDDTSDIPFGLGCGGTVELLFEAANKPEGEALMQAMAESLDGRESTVVSFLPGEGRGLRRVIFDSTGEVVFASPALNQHKIDCARGLSPDATYDGRFVEVLHAPQRLFVLVAGEDSKPLVEMAALLGWTVIVADSRANLATAARFPRADVVCVLPVSGEHSLDIGPKDAVILINPQLRTGSLAADRAAADWAALSGAAGVASSEQHPGGGGSRDIGQNGGRLLRAHLRAGRDGSRRRWPGGDCALDCGRGTGGRDGADRRVAPTFRGRDSGANPARRLVEVSAGAVRDGPVVKVAAIILAAGASTRMGQPKQLLKLRGERLLERAVRVAEQAGCGPVVVVLGASAELIQAECSLDHATVVMNPEWREGMASSIRCGVQQVDGKCDVALLMVCDQPAVTSDHLRKLVDRCTDGCIGGPVASSYAGRRGVPACFPASYFGELLLLRGDSGARHLLESTPAIELAGGELDIDTPLTLETAKSIYC